jgi:hypothetical protein
VRCGSGAAADARSSGCCCTCCCWRSALLLVLVQRLQQPQQNAAQLEAQEALLLPLVALLSLQLQRLLLLCGRCGHVCISISARCWAMCLHTRLPSRRRRCRHVGRCRRRSSCCCPAGALLQQQHARKLLRAQARSCRRHQHRTGRSRGNKQG